MWTVSSTDHTAPDDTALRLRQSGTASSGYTLVSLWHALRYFHRINSTTHNPKFPKSPLIHGQLTYDLAGNLSERKRSPYKTTTTYTYDYLNRLTDLQTQNTTL